MKHLDKVKVTKVIGFASCMLVRIECFVNRSNFNNVRGGNTLAGVHMCGGKN